ncbi:MAG: hypothetical protein STHCBS139747_002055 [Sporothrix thermara]
MACVTAALPRTRKCGCGTKAAGVGAANNNGSNSSSSSSSSSSNTKTPKSPPKRTYYKPPMSPRSTARSRIDPNALGRTDVSQLNIRAPPPPGGWSVNGSAQSSIERMSLAGSGQPDGGPFMLTGGSMGFFTGQDGQPSVFSSASGSYGQLNYSIDGPTNGHIYANGGGQDDFNSFLNSSLSLQGTLGELQLGGSDAAGLGSFDLNMHSRPGQMNGMHAFPYQQPTQTQPQAPPTTTTPSCCAPAPQQQQRSENSSTRHTPTSSTDSLVSNGGGTANSKSCCSSGSPATASSSASQQRSMLKSESVSGGSGNVSLSEIPPVSSAGAANGDAKPHVANGHGGLADQQYGVPPLDQQVYGHYAQQGGDAQRVPTWYRYPPEYGTVTAPLQLSQWRAGLTVTSGPNSGMFDNVMHQQHQHQQHQAYDNATIQSAFVQQNSDAMLNSGSSCSTGGGSGGSGGGGISAQDDLQHMCLCGDGCECVGCVVHPYNNATRNTVQSMWSLMDETSSTTSSTKTATPTSTTPTTMLSPQQQQTLQQQQQHQHQAGGNVDSTSPMQQSFTPSDTSGAGDDQVTLPAADFLFVSYSLTGCEGEGLTCPCGDDCQCVGCTIHNNTLMDG